MGAETSYYVRVLRTHEEWVEIDAITEQEAMEEASTLPNVVLVLDAKHHWEYENE